MASPVKRRVLAPLDANTSVSALLLSAAGKPVAAESKLPLSPPSSAIAKKRTLPETSMDDEPADSTTPLKKTCLASGTSPTSLPRDTKQPEQQQTLQTQQGMHQAPTSASPAVAIAAATSRPSLSPATSSVFDLSAMVDTSQATNITEPDVEVPRPANASGALTREQSRQVCSRAKARNSRAAISQDKEYASELTSLLPPHTQRAEILKLRLGLARYKVRTGQVDVPLEQLRVVPAATFQRQQAQQQRQGQLSREWSASEWVRQQQEQKQAAGSAGSSQPRQQPPLPQRWALWGPASSSTGGAPSSRGRDQGASANQTNNSDEEEDEEYDDDVLDSRPLPQQPRHQLDTVDVIEDSDVSDQDVPKRRRADEEEEDDDNDDDEEEEDDGDLPQLPQIRRLSPNKKSSSNGSGNNRHSLLTTPRGNRLLVDDGNGSHLDRLTSSAMRGSAVNGLLSLARS